MTDIFPYDEKFGLKSQINRSSVSIPSRIAEGSLRSNKSFSHFSDISLGSSYELETQLIIANKRNYITEEKLKNIIGKNRRISKNDNEFSKQTLKSFFHSLFSIYINHKLWQT